MMYPPRAAPAPDPLMRVSEFHRQQGSEPQTAESDAGGTRLAALSPSLMQDLLRAQPAVRQGDGLDVLQVLAAALRHGRALRLHLQLDYRVIPLDVLPASRQLRSTVGLAHLLALRLPELRVLRVEPAPAPDAAAAGMSEALGPLLWELALRGSRAVLLPEIGGSAAYRVTPGADLALLELSGSLAAAVARLRQQMTPLRDIAGWPGFDRDRASRLLNGLYLQSALMITRTHPSAIS